MAVVALLFGATLLSSAPAQAAEIAPTPAMNTDTYESKVQYWINVKRENHGLRKVRFEQCTDKYAERWGGFLAETLEFFHQTLTPLIDNCDSTYAGETLVRGMITPKQAVKLWMDSDGHRHILLSKSPNKVGIGAYVDGEGRWVVAADFTKIS
jgi:uncharacterized protein YkwD